MTKSIAARSRSRKTVKVLCTRSFTKAQLERLRAVSPVLEVEQRSVKSRNELSSALRPEVEVLFSTFAPESLEAVPNLRWLQARSAGMNSFVGTPLWEERRIIITTSSGIHATSIGEFVLGMMLALAREFRGIVDHQRERSWPKINYQRFPGRDLRGGTVLIIGYGSVGREVGRLSDALGMHVLAVKRSPAQRHDEGFSFPGVGDPAGTIPKTIVAPADLSSVLPLADFVVITTAATAENIRMIGDRELRLLKDSAFLINISRGDIIDEEALFRALSERWIAGAALDVFREEPLPPGSPLWALDNLIASPHISGWTPKYDDHVVTLFAENLRRYLSNEPLLNQVDRDRGY